MRLLITSLIGFAILAVYSIATIFYVTEEDVAKTPRSWRKK